MDIAIASALTAAVGFAFGDIATAKLARKFSGRMTMFWLSMLKAAAYLPFVALWWVDFTFLTPEAALWSAALGIVFAVAYLGFNLALQVGHPALVGVIAGSFPAVASLIAIVFLGQRPSPLTIAMLVIILLGVGVLGLPDNWRKSLKLDKGTLLALVPMVCWGIFTGLLSIPIGMIDTPHNWFVVQYIVALMLVLTSLVVFNKGVPQLAKQAKGKFAAIWLGVAVLFIGGSELLQALALGAGSTNTTLVAALLGSYPAVYFLLADRIFKERLIPRQWIAAMVVLGSIIVLSVAGS